MAKMLLFPVCIDKNTLKRVTAQFQNVHIYVFSYIYLFIIFCQMIPPDKQTWLARCGSLYRPPIGVSSSTSLSHSAECAFSPQWLLSNAGWPVSGPAGLCWEQMGEFCSGVLLKRASPAIGSVGCTDVVSSLDTHPPPATFWLAGLPYQRPLLLSLLLTANYCLPWHHL